MKLFVFTYKKKQHDSLIDKNLRVTRWTALLRDNMIWEDTSSDGLSDDAETIRREYLEDNGIYADEIGQIAPRFWWARVDLEKTAMNDFYAAGDVGAAGNLAWHTFYTFTHESTDDCISKGFEYIPSPDVRAAIIATCKGLRS